MNDTESFPPAWDERLSLDLNDVELRNVEDFKGYARMAVSRGNTAFLEGYQSAESRLARMMMIVRYTLFHAPSKDFAKAVGLSTHGYVSTEKDTEGRMPQFHTYHRALTHWGKKGISQGMRDQMLDLLTMPELFEQKKPKKRERYDPQPTLLEKIEEVRLDASGILNDKHANAFYHRIGFETGHPNVAKHFPKFWNKLWQREKIGTVPLAVELLEVIGTMYEGDGKAATQLRALRMAEGKALWTEVKMNQYRGRGIEEPLAELLAKMELDLAENFEWHIENKTEGMTLTAEALREAYGMQPVHAQALIQCELVGWDEIKPFVSRMIDPKSLKKFEVAWKAAHLAEKTRVGFGAKAEQAMEARGFNYKLLYDLLVRDKEPERAKPKTSDEGETRTRPENVIRHIIHDNAQSSDISIESLLRILTRSDAAYQELRDLFVAERERYYRRIGNRLEGDGLRMRILRELANMSMGELAMYFLSASEKEDKAAVRKKDLELQKLERNESKMHAISFARVFKILDATTLERAGEAGRSLATLGKFPEVLKSWKTVQELAENAVAGMKGAAYVTQAMEKYAAADSPDCLRSDLILDVASGKFVPPLRCFRVMAQGIAEKVLNPEVVLDWYERFPDQLKKGCPVFSPSKFQGPLSRVLCTMIGSLDSNLIKFFDRVEGVRGTQGTQLIFRIDEGTCDEADWMTVRKMLLGAGLKSSGIKWQFAELLFRNGQNVDAALEELVPRMRKLGIEITSEQLPGITAKELAKYQTSKRN